MVSIWDTNYIVIDVETTGGNSESNRITDIACVTTSGGIITDVFQSLINPHQYIPIFIQQMTGISNEMVFVAPEAKEVLIKVKDILAINNSVFVAHNVLFDYNFVKNSFAREEIDFPKIPRLCTIKLARRLLKKDIKKNVGSLAKYFGIKIVNRHRALGDAEATSKILSELLEIAEEEHSITTMEELLKFQDKQIRNFIPPSATQARLQEKLNTLPNESGVYYFMNKNKEIHYVGKAKNLNDRVKSYFGVGDVTSRKIATMLRKSYFLDWECTNSELSALIYESHKIKELLPYYNTVGKTVRNFPFIRLTINEDFPIIEICNQIEDDGAEYYGPFHSKYLAELLVENIAKRFKLRKCVGHISPNKEKRPCFNYHIESCDGACAEFISKNEYLEHVEEAKKYLSGYKNGIIKQLESKMYELSENLEYEQAGEIKSQISVLKKLFEKQNQGKSAITSDNFAMIISASNNEKLIQVLLVRCGKLEKDYLIGRKAPIDSIKQDIQHLYYNEKNSVKISEYSKIDIDDLNIINSWVFRNKNQAKFVFFDDLSFDDAIEKLSTIISEESIIDDVVTDFNDYIQ